MNAPGENMSAGSRVSRDAGETYPECEVEREAEAREVGDGEREAFFRDDVLEMVQRPDEDREAGRACQDARAGERSSRLSESEEEGGRTQT